MLEDLEKQRETFFMYDRTYLQTDNSFKKKTPIAKKCRKKEQGTKRREFCFYRCRHMSFAMIAELSSYELPREIDK